MRRCLLSAVLLVAASPSQAADSDYTRDVKPLLRAKCVACHGALRQKAKLRLDAGPLILLGGRNGPAVVAGKPDESLVLAAVQGKGHPRMPPEGEGEQLTEKEVKLLRDWI